MDKVEIRATLLELSNACNARGFDLEYGSLLQKHWYALRDRGYAAIDGLDSSPPAGQQAEPTMITRLREALKAIGTPVGNMVDRHEAVMRTMNAQLAWQRACTPAAIEYLLALAHHPSERPAPAEPLTLAQISKCARNAQILFCLDKYGSFEVAFARLIEAALAASQAERPAVKED